MGELGGNRAWTRSCVGSVAMVAMLVTAPGLMVSPAQAAAAVPTNLGIASREVGTVALDGGGLAFRATESGHGIDFNDDGDLFDNVVHVWDPATGTTNLEIAIGAFGVMALDGGGLAFPVPESEGGSDLNGNGGTTDFVMHVWDPATGTTNLEIAIDGSAVALDGGGLALSVSEFGQASDLNDDGDLFDNVVHVWDPVTGTTTLGIASFGGTPLDGGGLAFVASESGQRIDLNDDGDLVDNVVHVWDPVTGTTNLGIAGFGGTPLDGGGLAFPVSESGQGVDLNDDGDLFDNVVHVWDPATGTTNLGIASFGGTPLGGGGVAFLASESGQGGDLNDDGDTGDFVMHVWDPAAGTTNLGIATAGSCCTPLDGGGLAFLASESGQGGDLNDDGDTGDNVVHVWDPATGTTNLGIAGGGFGVGALDGGGLALLASESGQGGDLNDDGDTGDNVVHVWDPVTGTANLGIAGLGDVVALAGGGLAFRASESGQGVDFNDDGDTTDFVVHVWDPAASPEVCDGSDNDLDGSVDEGWPDADGDTIADCVDPDDDGDGIPDGEDPDVVVAAVTNLPATSISNGNRNAFLSRLDRIQTLVSDGDPGTAIDELEALRKRSDGCNGTSRERPDKNDWVVDCDDQRVIRDLVDQLITNLEATLPD